MNPSNPASNPDRGQARLSAILDALLDRAEQGDLDAAHSAVHFAAGKDPARAAKALSSALKIDPKDDASRLALARLRAGAGDLEAAEREALAVFAHAVDEAARAQAALALGDVCRLQGRYPEARNHYAIALGVENHILAGDPANPVALRWHARSLGRIAEIDAAEQHFDRARTNAEGAHSLLRALAVQIGEEPILAADLADSDLRLAQLALAQGAPRAMSPHLEQAQGRYEALALLEKDEPHWRDRLAETWALAAEAKLASGDFPAAIVAMNKATSQRAWLANREPQERWGLAAAWRQRAGVMAAIGDLPAAAESLSLAVKLGEQLCAAAPDAEYEARFLLHTRIEQANLALRAGDLRLAREATDAARAGAESFAWDAARASDFALAWDRLGETAKAVSIGEAAGDAFKRAAELRRMHQADSESASLKRALAAALIKSGEAALSLKRIKNARAAFAESFSLRLELAELVPGAQEPAHDLAVALERLGLAAAADGDPASARAAWEQELALVDKIHADNDPIGIRFSATVESLLADLGGKDADRHRQSARVRMAQLATLTTLTADDAALIAQLGSDL